MSCTLIEVVASEMQPLDFIIWI